VTHAAHPCQAWMLCDAGHALRGAVPAWRDLLTVLCALLMQRILLSWICMLLSWFYLILSLRCRYYDYILCNLPVHMLCGVIVVMSALIANTVPRAICDAMW
jgi:hypothetical protein